MGGGEETELAYIRALATVILSNMSSETIISSGSGAIGGIRCQITSAIVIVCMFCVRDLKIERNTCAGWRRE